MAVFSEPISPTPPVLEHHSSKGGGESGHDLDTHRKPANVPVFIDKEDNPWKIRHITARDSKSIPIDNQLSDNFDPYLISTLSQWANSEDNSEPHAISPNR